MNAENKTGAEPGGEAASGPDELQQRIDRVVCSIYADEADRSRDLCRLACEWQVDPERFRGMLLKAGLRASRASEIKTVLLCPEICHRFLARKTTWKESLAQSRGHLDGVALAAAALVGECLTRGHLWAREDRYGGWTLEQDGRRQFRLHHPDHGTLQILRVGFGSATAGRSAS